MWHNYLITIGVFWKSSTAFATDRSSSNFNICWRRGVIVLWSIGVEVIFIVEPSIELGLNCTKDIDPLDAL